MSEVISTIVRTQTSLRQFVGRQMRQRRLNSYLKSDRRPWRTGYYEYRAQYLRRAVEDLELLSVFRESRTLPQNYAFRLDARAVEIPWVLSRLGEREGVVLDAGSALNHEFVLSSPSLASKRVIITTLAPEADAFWRLGVSYVYGDLRHLDFRDELFDSIVCISTIEHVGMDNSLYAGKAETARRSDSRDFLQAVSELKRVLKPGGILYLSFPFGRYENHGWFQQFDAQLVDTLVAGFAPAQALETIFRYEPEGWSLSDRSACAECEFFDVHTSKVFDSNSNVEYPPDYPAGERGLACLELRK